MNHHRSHLLDRRPGRAALVVLAFALAAAGAVPPTASVRARRVHMRLVEANARSCLYRSAGCRQLGGTQNVQGDDTRDAGGEFVHVELALALRTDPAARLRAGQAIAAGLT